MSKKNVGYVIAALLIGSMVVMMIKSSLTPPESLLETATGTFVAEDSAVGLRKGDTPPDFQLETLSGDVVRLSDYKGKIVVLNFWATWCGPCKAEMPYMEQYYNKHKETENVEIIAVNLTKSETRGIENIEKFTEAFGLTFPIPLDKSGKVMDAYQVVGVPTSFILGSDGKIVYEVRGPMDAKYMESLIKDIE